MKKRSVTAVRPQLPHDDEEIRRALGAEEETLDATPIHVGVAEKDPRWAAWRVHVSP